MKTLFKLLFFAIMILPFQLRAQTFIANAIKQNRAKLHYPLSVERFYKQEGSRLMWVLKDTVKTPAWDAMQILDCVLQYGLNPIDYHPQELTYGLLHTLQTGEASNAQKALFDILLTDAVVTLINNLHYGKLNRDFPHTRIDGENINEFKADNVLISALDDGNMIKSVMNVQPQSEAYANLQHHIKLLTTKYSGNNYIKPENDIRMLAINMERLRWISTTGKRVHLTCIVREGVLTKLMDCNKQDISLGKALYNERVGSSPFYLRRLITK